MELVDTTLAEAEEFAHNLTKSELALYDLQWDELAPYLMYIKGARRDGKLVGITGAYRKFIIGVSTFRIVKEEYWNQGIGTELVRDWVAWMKAHHIPYSIRQSHPNNMASLVSFAKVIPSRGFIIGDIRYDILIFSKWAIPLRPALHLLLLMLHLSRKAYAAVAKAKMPKIRLNATLLKLVARFVDYEADHLPIDGRLIEYGFTLGKLVGMPIGKVLDVGCVALHNCVSSTLAFAGWDVYGLDVRSDWGFQHPGFQFIQGDVRDSGLPDEHFHVVVCVSTLEHIGIAGYYGVTQEDSDGDIVAAQEMKRLLRRGGRLFLTVPYCDSYFRRPEERVYDDVRLAGLFGDMITAAREIYSWVDGCWLRTDGSSGKDSMVCLELVKR